VENKGIAYRLQKECKGSTHRQGKSQLHTLHEDVIGVAGHIPSLLGDNAGVRHGTLDLCQHMQRDGLLGHRMQRSRL
jgi:hypothetical protein